MTSQYPHNFRLIRTIFPLLILIVVVVFFWSPAKESEIVSTQMVQGIVVEVNTGEGESLVRGNRVSMTTARIELPSGEHTRVLVVRQQLSEGDRVTLTETRFSDGQLRYRLVEEDERLGSE